MATRIKDLEEFVIKYAEELVARFGSQKQVLSAAILALYDLDDKARGDYMAKAVGRDISKSEKKLTQIEIAENIETLKHFIRYKIPSAEEKRLIESLRQLLADDSAALKSAEKMKHKKGRREPKEAG